jgi:hypothetical protein
MKLLRGLFMHFESEDFPVGTPVITPSGRRAVVVRQLTGASKRDCFSRVICRYEGGGAKDLVTLQPHQLKMAERRAPRWMQMMLAVVMPPPPVLVERRRPAKAPRSSIRGIEQLSFDFA